MSAPYQVEQLIAANRGTAEFNLAILTSESALEGEDLKSDQSRGAIRIALKLRMLVCEHAQLIHETNSRCAGDH